jgi:hypothetical protein
MFVRSAKRTIGIVTEGSGVLFVSYCSSGHAVS